MQMVNRSIVSGYYQLQFQRVTFPCFDDSLSQRFHVIFNIVCTSAVITSNDYLIISVVYRYFLNTTFCF